MKLVLFFISYIVSYNFISYIYTKIKYYKIR